jgi:hypothetical protein
MVAWRQQIDLIENHQAARTKHMRIFERLVLTLGRRGDHNLGRFAEIKQRRAHEIAHVSIIMIERGAGLRARTASATICASR